MQIIKEPDLTLTRGHIHHRIIDEGQFKHKFKNEEIRLMSRQSLVLRSMLKDLKEKDNNDEWVQTSAEKKSIYLLLNDGEFPHSFNLETKSISFLNTSPKIIMGVPSFITGSILTSEACIHGNIFCLYPSVDALNALITEIKLDFLLGNTEIAIVGYYLTLSDILEKLDTTNREEYAYLSICSKKDSCKLEIIESRIKDLLERSKLK